MHTPDTTLEIVHFRAAAGVSPETLRAASRIAAIAIARLEGFLDRRLVEQDDGVFVDIVHWRTRAHAEAAAASAAQVPELGNYFALIDPETIRMSHCRVLETAAVPS